MTALSWPERVAAVKHAKDCAALNGWYDECFGGYASLRCDCDRDARIGAGIEAALGARCQAHGDDFFGTEAQWDAAAARAFEEEVPSGR